jgi:hypothetical protein
MKILSQFVKPPSDTLLRNQSYYELTPTRKSFEMNLLVTLPNVINAYCLQGGRTPLGAVCQNSPDNRNGGSPAVKAWRGLDEERRKLGLENTPPPHCAIPLSDQVRKIYLYLNIYLKKRGHVIAKGVIHRA